MTDTAHPVRVRKIGHVGLYCRDLAKMVDFYTRVLGFKVSDVNEKGMTFLRFGGDHHSFVLAKMADDEQKKGAGATLLQQIAMEVASLDALKRIRKYLLSQGVNVRGKIKHGGRATTTPSTSTTRKGIACSSSATWTASAGTERAGRRSSGSASRSRTSDWTFPS